MRATLIRGVMNQYMLTCYGVAEVAYEMQRISESVEI